MPSEHHQVAATAQNAFLEALRKDGSPVSVYLVSGIRLQGRICAFDQFTVSVEGAAVQVIYKRAISTIAPAAAVPPRTAEIPPPEPQRRDHSPVARTVTIIRRKSKQPGP